MSVSAVELHAKLANMQVCSTSFTYFPTTYRWQQVGDGNAALPARKLILMHICLLLNVRVLGQVYIVAGRKRGLHRR